MTVHDLVNAARYGELANLYLSDENEENTDKIISFINLGLTDLYRRFNLRVEEAIVSIKAGVTLYTLKPDSGDVYMKNDAPVNTILSVYDKEGMLLPINEEHAINGIFIPTWNTIQVPYPTDDNVISVLYTSSHIPVTKENMDAIVPLPDSMIESVLHYIGYKAYLHNNSSVQGENNAYFMRYVKSLDDIERLGLVNVTDVTGRSTQDKGYV
jgi:hypothetical protein